MPTDLETLLVALGEARAELLAALEGITQDQLTLCLSDSPDEASDVRELLWRTGVFDDWTRLVLDQGLGGRPTAAWAPRVRPAYLDTPERLRTWLEQTRGALLARARHVTPIELDRGFGFDDGARATPRELLAPLIERDREAAVRIRAVLE